MNLFLLVIFLGGLVEPFPSLCIYHFPLACDVEEVFGEYCNVMFIQEVDYILEPYTTCIVYFIIRF